MPKILLAFLGWVGGAKRGDHQALRDTWLKDITPEQNIDYRFFIGDGSPVDPDEDQKINAGFQSWANTNRGNTGHAGTMTKLGMSFPVQGYVPQDDEVLVPCPDGYHYMSYKRKESLRWALERGYDYIFCLSNDVYVRPERLVASDFQKYDYHGMMCGNIGFKGQDNFLPESYVFGGGYWLSAKAAQIIVDTKVTYWCEDWWVGLALAPAVRRGEISRNDAPINTSRYAIAPRVPTPNNNIISAEMSAGNYDKARMYACHRPFSNAPSPNIPEKEPLNASVQMPSVSAAGTYRYDRTGLVVDWWDLHPEGK